jgi:hypothetical protein
VRKFYPEVRLKKLISAAGGIRVDQALERAERELESIREDCLAAIDAKIEAITTLARTGDEQSLRRCYAIANEVFAEAGVFKLEELSAAAHSLCSLLAEAGPGAVPAKAVVVHTDAMRALRSPAMADSREIRRAVLSELRKMVARIAPARTAAADAK